MNATGLHAGRFHWILCALGCVLAVVVGPADAQRAPETNPASIASAMLRWRIGIDRTEPAYEMIETIAPALFDGRRVWRITHYAFDPTGADGAGFDLYDVDAATMSPVRSVMRNATLDLSISFDPASVVLRRVEHGAAAEERIAATGPVMPEGPGQQVFVAALPLKVGYRLNYQLVDRWGGQGQARLKTVTLAVRERRRADTALGRQEIFEVTIEAADGSFRLVEQVRARAPYYPVRVEYFRGRSRNGQRGHGDGHRAAA